VTSLCGWITVGIKSSQEIMNSYITQDNEPETEQAIISIGEQSEN
jgi:hypothetical protein